MACGGDVMDIDTRCSAETMTLNGPDQYHLYIGYDRDDQDARVHFKDISESLEDQNFLVFHDTSTDGHAINISNGTRVSQKMVILITKSYLAKTVWFPHEKKHVLDKVNTRSMPESLCLLLFDVEAEELPDDLQGYAAITHGENKLQYLVEFLSKDITPHPSAVSKYNMGVTLACGHFYGYLRFVLQGLRDRIQESRVHEMAGRRVMSLKMFVVLPVSCLCPSDMCAMDPVAISQCSTIPYNVSKGGIKARDYKATVYEIKGKEELYRVVMEFPGTLTTLYDMVNDKTSGMSRDECRREVDLFYFHLRALLTSHGLQDAIHIIYLNDHQQAFVDCIVHHIKEQIKREQLHPVCSEPKIAGTFLSPMKPVDSKQKITWEKNRMAHYMLDVPEGQKRGKAFIFNNEKFQRISGLDNRRGTENDIKKMHELFKLLQFEVHVFRDLTAAEMNNKVAELCESTNFQTDRAVAFCIMSHAKLGQLYGTDGGLVKITHLTRELAQVQTLHRKPKMFFIQACQRGRGTSSQSSTEPTTPVSPSPAEDMETEIETSVSSNGDDASQSTEQTARQDSGYSSDMSHTGISGPLQKLTEQEMTQPNSPIQAIYSINFHPSNDISVGTQVADSDSSEGDLATADLVPGAPDFVMSYATLPGCLAWRYSGEQFHKTFYLDALYEKIHELRSVEPLDRILMKVSEFVKDEMEQVFPHERFYKRQFPFYLQTTDKLIYLD